MESPVWSAHSPADFYVPDNPEGANGGKPERSDDPDSDRQDPSGEKDGDPIHLSTGEFYWERSFMRQSGSQLPFYIDLYYGTFSNFVGPLGGRWVINFNMRIFETDEVSVDQLILRRDDGQRELFEDADEDGIFVEQGIGAEKIHVLTSGPYAYRFFDLGIYYYFDAYGLLRVISSAEIAGNPDGQNELRISYYGDDGPKPLKLPVLGLPLKSNFGDEDPYDPVVVTRDYRVKSVDEYHDGVVTGRFFDFTYDDTGSGATGLLQSITDHSGRYLEFEFSASSYGDLSLVSESSTAANADDITYAFTYYDTSADFDRNYFRYIKGISRQRDCVSCNVLTNTYYHSSNVTNADRGKILSQVMADSYGNGIGEGETINNISYTDTTTTVTHTINTVDKDGTPVLQTRIRRSNFIDGPYEDKRLSSFEEDRIVDGQVVTSTTTRYYYGDGRTGDVSASTPGYAFWKQRRRVEPDGSTIDFFYDSNGLPSKEIDSIDATTSRVMERVYDDEENVIRRATYLTVNGAIPADSNVYVTVYEYDDSNRLTFTRILRERPASASATAGLASWTLPSTTGTDASVAGDYLVTENRYFASGSHQGKLRITLEWNLNPISGSLEKRRTRYNYGDANAPYRPSRVYNLDEPERSTYFTYDTNGNIDTRTNARSVVTDYDYTSQGRLKKSTMDSGGYGYESLFTYAENSSRLALSEQGKGGSALSQKTYFTYDSLSRQTGVYVLDDLGGTAVSDDEGNWVPKSFTTYDNESRLLTDTAVVTLSGSPVTINGLPDGDLGYLPGQTFTTRYAYDNVGNRTHVVIPMPTYDAQGNVNGSTVALSEFQYDVSGRMTSRIEPAPSQANPLATVTYRYEYDGLDRIVREIDAEGSDLQRERIFTYDAIGNLLTITRKGEYNSITGLYGDASITRFYYDGLGRRVGINWNPVNLAPDVDGARVLPMQMLYDDFNRQVQTIDGVGHATVFYYDSRDMLVGINWDPSQATFLANYQGALPQKLTTDAVGNVLSRTDGEGNTTYFHYDSLNRRTHISLPQPSGQSLTGNWWENVANVLVENTYNTTGRITSRKHHLAGSYSLNSDSLASNRAEEFSTYDRWNRVIGTTDLNNLSLTYSYNNFGQTVAVVYPEVNLGDGVSSIDTLYNLTNPGLVDSVSDRSGNITRYTYNLRGERASIKISLGAETTYAYDLLNRLVGEFTDIDLDGSLESTLYTYDHFDQLTSTTYPDHIPTTNERIQMRTFTDFGQLDTQTGAATYDVDYDYDLSGRRTHMTTQYGASGSNATTIWHYNGRNQMVRKEHADTSDYDYTYWNHGSVKTRTDAKEQETKYYYTEYNILEVVDYPTDGDVKFEYDELGRRTQMYRDGMTDDAGVYTSGQLEQEWTYYLNNAPRLDKQYLSNYQVAYTYTSQGSRDTRTVDRISGGDAWTLTYGYDAANRMASILDSQLGATPFQYQYKTDASLIENRINPSGSSEYKGYDIRGRLTQIATRDALNTDLDRHSYTYDQVGQRKDHTLLDGTIRDYDYDTRRQLISADAGSGYEFSYGYDAIGNRLSLDDNGAVTTYTPDSLNQYDSISGTPTPSYDANGSLSGLAGTTYAWDEENRLQEISNGTQRTVSIYDGLNRRMMRQEYTNTTLDRTLHYVYDGNLPVLEVDGGGTKLRSYTRGLDMTQSLFEAGGVGSLLALTIHDASIGTVGSYYYGCDGNGNITVLLDDTNALAGNYTYDPFGKVLSSAGSIAAANPYQFSSKEYESQWATTYYLYRFYSPEIGRWLSRDPIGELGGLNLYGFVGNNGVNFWDYLGMYEKGDGAFTDKDKGFFDYFLDELKELNQIQIEASQALTGALSDFIGDVPLAMMDAMHLAVLDFEHEGYSNIYKSLTDPNRPTVEYLGFEFDAEFLATPVTEAVELFNAGYDIGTAFLNEDYYAAKAGLLMTLVEFADRRLPGKAPNTGGVPEFTFRGDTRSPNEIFNDGFDTRGDSNDLFLHALDNRNPPSNFVSTSRSFDEASNFADNVYVVRPRDGIDVNDALGSRSPFPHEQEIAIPNGVSASDIRAVTLPNQGVSVLNPNWNP